MIYRFALLAVFASILFCDAAAGARTIDRRVLTTIYNKSIKYDLPMELIASYALVESNFNPYALNIAGKGYLPKSLDEAKRIISGARLSWKDNFDMGVMQINSSWGDKFGQDIDSVFDIDRNIDFGAYLIKKNLENGWHWKSIALYNTPRVLTPHALRYARKVINTYKTLTNLRKRHEKQ